MPAPEDGESAFLVSTGEEKALWPQLLSSVQQQQQQLDSGKAAVGFSLQKMSAMAASISQVRMPSAVFATDALRAEAGVDVRHRSASENHYLVACPALKCTHMVVLVFSQTFLFPSLSNG